MPLDERTRACAERMRLLDDLNRATTVYARIASDLQQPLRDFELKRIEGEQAKLDVQQCREALIKHRTEQWVLNSGRG